MTPSGATVKGSSRRAQVLAAATAILTEKGQNALTLRSVADQVGIRLSNVQYYFATRDGLVAALLDHYLTEALSRLREPLSELSPPEAVRRLLDDQCDRAASVLFTEVWSLAAHSPEVEAAVRAFYLRYEQLVAEYVHAVRPDLAPAERASRARVFVLLLEGASLFRAGVAGDRDAASDEVLHRTAVGLLS